MPHLRAVLALVLGLVCLVPRIAAQSAEAPRADSPLRQGVLPNGLRYAVLPHPSPKGDISLRLIVRAGSLDEHDNERGFAHFVEHMAFNGTKHHPPGTVRNFFQRLGLTFGADINASTSYTHTTYLLDLPDGRADQLDEAMSVMRDYADGQLFLPDQVTRESTVMLSELKARDSAARRNAMQMVDLLYAGTRLPDREIGGVAAQLESATPDQLRAFYRRNYLPDRMTVLVVGPVEPAAIVEKITASFGSMARAPEGVAPAPPVEPPPFQGIKPDVVMVPTVKGSAVQFLSIGTRPPDTVEGHRRELLQRIAIAALHTRMRERREREDLTKYGPPRVSYDAAPIGSLVHHMLGVPTTASGWTDAVPLAETELRRARTAGFTQAEVDEAISGQLTATRNRVAELASQPAARIATEFARLVSLDRRWQTPEAVLAETTQALEGLTAAEVTAALQEVFPPDSMRLLLTVAPGNDVKPERLLSIYTKSAGRTLKKNSAAAEELAFNYDNLGPPGAVAKREQVDDLNLTLVSFENGVRLNVRPSTLEPDRFRLRIVFPSNYANIPADRGGIVELAGHLLLNSDLGKQKQNELARLIKLHGIAPQFSVTNGTPVLGFSGPAEELKFTLHFLAALLSDLKLDTDHYRVAMSLYANQHRSLLISPGPFAQRLTLRLFASADSRIQLNPPAVVARFPTSDAEDWLSANILHGPLEIGLVGDFTTDEAIATAAATVGTLKKRRNAPRPGPPLKMVTKPARYDTTAELPASVAVSCVFWPIETPDDPNHNAALALATDVLRDRLVTVLREALGLTYTPDARLHRDVAQRDFAFASMINTFDPTNAQKLTEGSVRLAARLALSGVTTEEFTRLREPARTRAADDMRNNTWWLNAIVSRAQSRPDVIELARHHAKIFDNVTIEEVNEAAKVFTAEKMTILVLRPTAAKETGAAGAKKK